VVVYDDAASGVDMLNAFFNQAQAIRGSCSIRRSRPPGSAAKPASPAR